MLLKRLRNVMARGGAAQLRLDQTVKLIAGEMVAEVCSIYLLRAGEVLELFATEGLKKEAVHKTRLRVGEGLVGDIASHARPLALADAQHHPQFAYRPETGEELFQSLMGVPILRAGRVIGVLVIQNRTRRQYTEEEIETLETVAMVLAELVASGELVSADELRPGDGIALLPLRLDGITLCPGLARGVAVLHQQTLQLQQLVAEDPGAAKSERLAAALMEMQSSIDTMLSAGDIAGQGEHFEVLETYRLFAQDQGWRNRMMEAVQTGLTAEAAVQKVQNDTRARMREVTDPYLRERLADLDDLANRLLRHLLGADMPTLRRLPEEAIVVARTMGPAELLDYDRTRLKGVVLEEGSQNAHVAIVARALDIPVLGRCQDLMQRVGDGDPLVIDGDNATLFIRPSDDIQATFAESMRQRSVKREAYAAIRDLPAVTRDGISVDLNINAGLLMDVPQLAATNAVGIGLYRTEIPFMISHEYPDVTRQTEIYRKVLDGAGNRPVIFRTLDIGSDKVLPVLEPRAGGESRDGLARHPHRARSAGDAAPAAARHDERGSGAHAVGHVPDGDRAHGIRFLPPPPGSRAAAPGPAQHSAAERGQGRRHGGGAGAAVAAAGTAPDGPIFCRSEATICSNSCLQQIGTIRLRLGGTTRWRLP